MHRLAPDDLAATIERYADIVLKLPLIAEESENAYSYMGKTIMWRQPGEVLNPSRMSIAEVELMRARIAPHVFASQLQHAPRSAARDIARSSVSRVTPKRRPPS
jgi:hypothetical protein